MNVSEYTKRIKVFVVGDREFSTREEAEKHLETITSYAKDYNHFLLSNYNPYFLDNSDYYCVFTKGGQASVFEYAKSLGPTIKTVGERIFEKIRIDELSYENMKNYFNAHMKKENSDNIKIVFINEKGEKVKLVTKNKDNDNRFDYFLYDKDAPPF